MKLTRLLPAILAIASVMPSFAAKKNYVYTDASKLTMVNRAQPDCPFLARLDTTKYRDLNKYMNNYYNYPTGMALVFETNSPDIAARWTTHDAFTRSNTMGIASRGLDLYILQDGKWVTAGTGSPRAYGKKHSGNIVTDMDRSMKTCLLYLPIFDRLESLSIGIDSASVIRPVANPWKKKVVFMGSSITHGAGVSRPGTTYPARIARALGVEAPNLGISGQCKMEPVLAQIIADTDADAFVFDCFSNPNAQQIRERLMPFVEIIRKAHPTTPLIFLQTERRETRNFDLGKRAFEEERTATSASEMEKVMKKFNDVYFINPGMPLGDDHEGCVDGVHPTDLGTYRIAEGITPQLRAILAIYGIVEK